MAVACFTYGWGRWCACLFLGACPVGAWEQWRWRVLRAGSVGLLLRRRILVEVRTLLCGAGSVGVRLVLGGASFARRSGPISGCGWGLAAWRVFCARLWVYPVCYEVDNSPLFNFNRIFPPFLGARGNLCAETSYLRVQCLCGRADVWSARAVGATILDVFGYGGSPRKVA